MNQELYDLEPGLSPAPQTDRRLDSHHTGSGAGHPGKAVTGNGKPRKGEKGHRILIIEDDPASQELFSLLLEDFGYLTRHAADGEQGLALARRERPDLIICDVRLPKLDGVEVVRQLKNDETLANIPALAVTGYDQTGERERLLAAGFDDYLPKPIAAEKFIGHIEDLLGSELTSEEDRAKAKSGNTILIIDDRPLDRELLVTLLDHGKHRVLEAGDGLEALRLIKAEHPDLVISDVLLPQMDGYEMVRQLRADPSLSGIKVIFYTGVFDEQEALDLAQDCGVDLILSKPTDPQKILQSVEEMLKAGASREISFPPDTFDQKHQQLLINKLIREIDALHRSEERERDRAAQLEAANRELESFSYSVSHDLKTPLRAIQGFSRILLEEHSARLDAEGLRLLKVICDNTNLMDKLIDDLLALSQLGRHPMRKVVCDLRALTQKIFEQLQSREPERDLQLSIGELPPAPCDYSLTHQVMTNLLDNALKYTRGQKTAKIEVGGLNEGNEVIYYVKDNGVGFNMDYVNKLFGVFQRLHSSQEYEGTGVGLAIVQRIIQRHGGRVWAEGNVGDGATFYFTLPANGECNFPS
jgi:CheY-like chemotaxis protein